MPSSVIQTGFEQKSLSKVSKPRSDYYKLQLELFFYEKTDVSPLFVVRNIKMSLKEISNWNNGQLSANNPGYI